MAFTTKQLQIVYETYTEFFLVVLYHPYVLAHCSFSLVAMETKIQKKKKLLKIISPETIWSMKL